MDAAGCLNAAFKDRREDTLLKRSIDPEYEI